MSISRAMDIPAEWAVGPGPDAMSGLSIVFLHPDLGIGGAERLVVDAALALQGKGHRVAFLTAHHDPAHSFPETNDGSFPVLVRGSCFPRSIGGRCFALCAYVRMLLAALYLIWPWRSTSELPVPDVVFCDQVSAPIPLLRLARLRVLFYCHFPDLLLSAKGSPLKTLYRWPLDFLEEWSTGLAHKVVVNSKFTEGVFRSTFLRLSSTPVSVLYPTLNTTAFDAVDVGGRPSSLDALGGRRFFLSLNRFERKKNVDLAIKAFDVLRDHMTEREFTGLRLVVAGGYDGRVAENLEHYAELRRLATAKDLGDAVIFLKSPSESVKHWLLANCVGLLYTPRNEHFGIVPLEAAYAGRPVVAANSGGPLETVVDGTTGFLRPDRAEAFGSAMLQLAGDAALASRLGAAGRRRVESLFTPPIFATKLDRICVELAGDVQ